MIICDGFVTFCWFFGPSETARLIPPLSRYGFVTRVHGTVFSTSLITKVSSGQFGVYPFAQQDQELSILYLEILVPYLNNPSEEAIFGSNKSKEKNETMTLQNEDVMLKNT